MVFFGAPESTTTEQQVSRAIACGERMLERLQILNEIWVASGLESFAVRIGVHHGPAIVGSFGGPDRSDYTAIGSTVNIAARIQAVALPNSLILTQSVRDYMEEDRWSDFGIHQLKGIDGGMRLYQLKTEKLQ